MAESAEEKVELGFISEEGDKKLLQSAFFPSKIGGRPSWLHLSSLPSTEALACQMCGKPTIFLMQVYAPIEGKPSCFHRTLFVFICRDPSCSKPNDGKNFVVFRSQLPRRNPFYSHEPPDYDSKKKEEIHDASEYQTLCIVCGCIGTKSCSGCKKRDFCSKEHQKVDWTLGGHKGSCGREEPLTSGANHVFLFPEVEIETEPEEAADNEERDIDTEREMEKARRFEEEALASSELEAMASKETPGHTIFAAFKKRVARAPDQVLRYSRTEEPLLISESPLLTVPPCEYCKGPRKFEFQVMPQLLTHLKVDDVGASIDWGVLVVFTCADSCDIPLSGKEATAEQQTSPEFAYKREFLVKQDLTR